MHDCSWSTQDGALDFPLTLQLQLSIAKEEETVTQVADLSS